MSQSAKAEKSFTASDKQQNIRITNITAAKGECQTAVSDAVRTSLGPRGMDKMIKDSKGEVTITNDGATILKQMEVIHPAAKMVKFTQLVELSKSQDIEAGDGTTSVVVIAGEMLHQCSLLLERGIHPTAISDAFKEACDYAADVLTTMATPVDLSDEESLIKSAATSLASKLVSQNAPELAPIAVRAVRSILGPDADNVDLRDIKVEKCLGGTIDDSELIEGLVFVNKHASHAAGGPTRIQTPKIGLIQFCLSAPKTDMENSVVVSDYSAMDRVLREERAYIVNLCKKIVSAGCNVLLIQKSVLRDATNDLSLHYLAKNKVMVIKDIEREDVDFISRTIGLTPVAHIDQFTVDKLGSAENCVEESGEGGKVIRITGNRSIHSSGKTATILLRGSQQLVLDEAERSLHDALCVVRSLVKRRALLPGGGAPEIEMSYRLARWARERVGVSAQCIRAFAEALEVVPYTLAENAGLDPMRIVTDLRNRHISGDADAGINVRRGTVTNMREESVVQPLLVTLSAITLATECVRMVLKIDDVVMVR